MPARAASIRQLLVVSRRVEVSGDRVEVIGKALLARRVGGLLDHGLEDGLEEAEILGKSGFVVGGEGGFDGFFGGGSDEFEAADEDANGADGGGRDAERQDGVHKAPGNDVNEARAFLEPGIFPGFEHGVGLIREKAFGGEDAFEIVGEGIDGSGKIERGEGGLIAERAENAVAGLCATTFEENDAGDWFGEVILKLHGVIRGKRGGERW